MFLVYPEHCPSDDLDEAGTKRLGVVNLAGGRPMRRTLGVSGERFLDYSDELSVAGRWLAVAAAPSNERRPGDPNVTEDGTPIDYSGSDPDRATTIVLDLASGDEAYRVRQTDTSDGYQAVVDQQARLFTVTGAQSGCRGRLAVHTVKRPTPRPLPGRACSPVLAADSGAVVYEGKDAGGQRALMAANADGGQPRAIASLGEHGVLQGFDLSGRNVAYSLATCGTQTAIRLASLDARGPGRPLRSSCSVRMSGPPRLAVRERSIPVRLLCPGGCRGVAVLRRLSRGAGKPERITSTTFETNERHPLVSLPASSRQRASLHHGDRARLDLYAESRNRSSQRPVRRRLRLQTPGKR